MDQTMQKVVRFDRFVLDLTRGCLRAGEQEIDLPPKAFQVLTYLALNVGRLVPKEELLKAVWANVAVTDESLVQCIRQLRQKLGDEAHRLVKTVPRRGYLLEAAPTGPAQSVPVGRAPDVLQWLVPGGRALAGLLQNQIGSRRAWAGAAVLLCILLATAQLPGLLARSTAPLPPATQLFTQDDAKRVAAVAVSKQLPLPAFQIREPSRDLPKDSRRFVGVWVSDTGWMLSHRQLMLIVTQVDGNGIAVGYAVDGPPQPKTPVQTPAESHIFQARISGDSLVYDTESPRGILDIAKSHRAPDALAGRKGWSGFAQSGLDAGRGRAEPRPEHPGPMTVPP
jgi:DNA-binding winged helix-turn-helix (wHTH) protein